MSLTDRQPQFTADKIHTIAPQARTKEDAGVFNGENEEPYKEVMAKYDRQHFAKHPEQDVPWPADPESVYEDNTPPEENETTSEENIDTEPMPSGNVEMDAVHWAKTLEEALREYRSMGYSLEAVNSGKMSPQLAMAMLLGIRHKFAGKMTPEQAETVDKEIIEMGEAINRLPDQPPEKSKEWVSVLGMMKMPEVIDIIKEREPEKVPAFMEGLEHVAKTVDSRGEISEPIRAALKESGHLEDNSFEDIVKDIAFENIDKVEERILVKAKKQLDEEEEAKKRKADAVLANLVEIAKRNAKEAKQQYDDLPPTGIHDSANQPMTAAMPKQNRSKLRRWIRRNN